MGEKNIRVLVACEESGRVTEEFRKRGIEAYSCDIIPTSGNHPEWHIMQDVLPLLDGNCEFQTCDGATHKIDDKWDCLISFPPCFIAGTLVMTYEGLKNIEDVQVGDLVLTHKGRYKKVLDVMSKTTNEIVTIHSENCGYIICTPNHPFYTRTIKNTAVRENGKLKRVRLLSDFEWIAPKDFIAIKNDTKGSSYKQKTYLTTIRDQIYKIPNYEGFEIGCNAFANKISKKIDVYNPKFWYLVGRWLGDGFFYKKNHEYYGISICCDKKKTEQLKKIIESVGFHYKLESKRTADNFYIYGKELSLFFRQFGEGALNKHIPGFVTRLPQKYAEELLNGYWDSDGNMSKTGVYSFSSISKKLAYGIKYMVNKYYGVACSIKQTPQHTNIIEGRLVNVHDLYVGSFRKEYRKQTHYLNYENYILAPFISTEFQNQKTVVYNLSVEDDESYTANGLVVHNCTHLAVSGAPSFEKKRIDGRQREGIKFFCKFLVADCDHIAIENPVNIISGDYISKWFPDLAEKYGLPRKPTQSFHPWNFGDNFAKKTCLWLKGLPPLIPEVTEEPELEYFEWIDKNGKKKRQPLWYFDALRKTRNGEDRSKLRSKTFPGVAKAIAEQWGNFLKSIKE